MNIKRPWAPGFINRLDNYLLMHHPEIWSIRAHLVFYYSMLFTVLLAGICYIIPYNPLSGSNALFYWGGFLGLVSLIGFVYWMIYLLRFNVFKRYGIISRKNTLITFLLYFLTAASIGLFPFIPSLVEKIKADRDFGGEEIVSDINEMNLAICRLEFTSLPEEWDADSLLVVNSLPKSRYDDDEAYAEDDSVIHSPVRTHDIKLIDTSELSSRLAFADSSIKLNDSMYVLYTCPEITFINTNGADDYTAAKILSSRQIYDIVFAHYTTPDKTSLNTTLQKLLDKYYSKTNEPRYTYNENPGDEFREIIKHYKLNIINKGVQNVVRKKYLWNGESGALLLRIILYISLILSLLIFLFRHSTLRIFFLSLLTCLVLFTISSIIMAISFWYGTGMNVWGVFYFLLFTVMGAFVFRQKVRKSITGIAINLWVLLLPFVPLMIVSLYYTIQRQKYYFQGENGIGWVHYDLLKERQYLQIAEFSGPALFLIVLYLYIHNLYRKWYALPED